MDNNLGQVILVKDINPGRDDNSYSYKNGFNPGGFVEFNGKLYFAADKEGRNGLFFNRELWVSDGTTDGTQLLVDINPGGENSSSPLNIKTKTKRYYLENTNT